MHSLLLAIVLICQPPAAEPDSLRAEYQADAEKYVFHHDVEQQHALKWHDQPIMRWANDDAWSGDVFVWTHAGRPQIVGCILSGPIGNSRLCYHEFHSLAEGPLAPVDLQTKRRWAPELGVARLPVKGAPPPAESASGRLVQMRQLCRDFTAHMEADGSWELRLLPQPLFRYGEKDAEVVDGALFAYVWTKGTDPELLLMLECRKSDDRLAWHYAPVRFSNRPLSLEHDGQEVWSVESHREPAENVTSLIYTTAYARPIISPEPAELAEENPPNQ